MPRSPARLATRRSLVRSFAATAACAGAAAAQAAPPADSARAPAAAALRAWLALEAPPGREPLAASAIRAASPDWRQDALGNLVVTRGTGSPKRIVACGLDQGPSYVVSEITDAGYLRLQRAGNIRAHALWDQFHEGQQLRVVSRRGGVPAVSAVRSTHLQRGASAQDPPPTVAELWVDVGARSRAEVERLGVRLLDPVVREWPAWEFADFVSGPRAGARIACAAVAAAAAGAPASGQTTFVLSALSTFGLPGLLSTLDAQGAPDTLVVVQSTPVRPRDVSGETRDPTAFVQLPPSVIRTGVLVLSVPAHFATSLAESVRLADVDSMLAVVARAAGLAGARVAIPALPARDADSAAWWDRPGRDSIARAAALLGRLAKAAGVSGHEARVRDIVRAELPSWAARAAEVDSAGNLVVAAGPDRDTALFVAHLDEVGFEVTGFAADGTVSLRTRGGFYGSLWEGQPAELHLGDEATSPPPLRGVFVPRQRADARQPASLTAWFGLDSAQLAARGVHPGQQVLAFKYPRRLAGTRMTARAVDDRAGTAALLMALRRLDPARLRRKVIFAWSVREETGLEGARVLAERFGRSTRRVYAVDTFVSSDSPLESTRFAHTPLGAGAVVRALDNSSVTPPDEVDRVTRAARRARIPVQVGTTNGGNDGSVFVRYGAVDIPLSWPGRYSHSPVEVLDLLDLLALSRLVRTLAEEP